VTSSSLEALLRHVLIGDGCWEWMGGKQWGGYGLFRGACAHRLFYELLVGPIPAGLEIDHLCRNRSCVRPTHLEPVTHLENMRRAREVWGKVTTPPPPALRRGQTANRSGRTHGYESTYMSGCRCDACRSAHTVNARRRADAKRVAS
jgi:hypothetical protein